MIHPRAIMLGASIAMAGVVAAMEADRRRIDLKRDEADRADREDRRRAANADRLKSLPSTPPSRPQGERERRRRRAQMAAGKLKGVGIDRS